MKFLSITLLLVLPRYIFAAGTPGEPQDLDKQYRIQFINAPNNGGCQGYEEILRTSYGEAFRAVKAASDSLKIIRGNRPNQATDPAGWAKWGRIARVFSALFGAGEQTFRIRGRYTAMNIATGKIR
jgi:hypothetical protein